LLRLPLFCRLINGEKCFHSSKPRIHCIGWCIIQLNTRVGFCGCWLADAAYKRNGPPRLDRYIKCH
jgi:hypothetical protein